MKIISTKEAQRISFEIMATAEQRRIEYFEGVAVATLDEDIEEELLMLCRRQISDICEDLILRDNLNEIIYSCTQWAEAGEQIYAEWRGWV